MRCNVSNLEIVGQDKTGLHIKLNRTEKRNALSSDLVEQLHSALDAAEGSSVQAIVLEGNGKNFSAGFDFTGIAEESLAQTCWRFVRIQQLLQRLGTSRVLTVALAPGRNFGEIGRASCRERVCQYV